jgi:hypothetical protein
MSRFAASSFGRECGQAYLRENGFAVHDIGETS